MYQTRVDRRNLLRVSLIAALVVALLVSGFLLLKKWEDGHGQFDGWTAEDEVVEYNGKQYVLKDNVETFLVLGLDKFEEDGALDSYNNNHQADFLMLLVFDNDAQTCTAIHINRDTMASVDVLGVAGQRVDTVTKQIALAHTYGNGKEVSCRNTANAVSKLLRNVDVDHYASVTMEAVSIYNDMLGGVTLEVLDDFSGVDDSLVKGEIVTLKGDATLTYIRARDGMADPTNVARMKRQKQYMAALYDQTKVAVADDEGLIARAAAAVSGYMVSDCSGNRLEELLNRLTRYELGGILEIDGKSVKGDQYMEFYPDEAALMKIVIDCFYREKN